jgi:hypothetical protein
MQKLIRSSRVLALLSALASSACAATPESYPPASRGQAAGPTATAFPLPFSSALPYDVDLAALRALSTTPDQSTPPYTILDDQVPAAQRWFDLFSWQAFLALNWPALPDGAPDNTKTLADTTAPRVWEHWVDVGQVFRPDGAAPAGTWEQLSSAAAQSQTLWMHGLGFGKPAPTVGDKGYVRDPLLDESLQAFTGPMVDQNGKWVRYQVALNRTEFDYLVENQLYNLDGQVAHSARERISFPTNQGTRKHGAMEIKLSWKQLGPDDNRSRFLVRRCSVTPLTGEPFTADFGLVGMHISARTESSPTWIWATFEQVDNTSANDLELGDNGRPLRPNFFNPDNPAKPVNILPAKNAAPVPQYNPATGRDDGPALFTSWDEALTTDPTQTLMVLPVPKATAALNHQVQTALRQLGSVFQYYELIGTQWPTDPAFPSFTNGVNNQADGRMIPASPESILYKVPGKLVPVHLVNTTMETFFQNGNQPAGPVAWDDRLPPGLLADPNTIFATESCAGCHFSAGAAVAFKKDMNLRTVLTKKGDAYYPIPIFGQNAVRGATGDADYSWLLQLRAQARPIPAESLGPDFARTGRSKDYVLLDQASGVLIPPAQKVVPAE